MRGNGFLANPMPCTVNKGCALNFDLHFATLDLTELETALLGGSGQGGAIKDLLAGLNSKPRPWPTLKGNLLRRHAQARRFSVHNARAALAIAGTQTQIESLDGESLGGYCAPERNHRHHRQAASLHAQCRFKPRQPADIAALFHEKWGSGTMNANAKQYERTK